EDLPREQAGTAGIGGELLHARGHVLDLVEGLRRLLDRLVSALGAVLESLRIERLDALFALLVEAAAGLVAEDLLLDHRADVRGHLEDVALLVVRERRV